MGLLASVRGLLQEPMRLAFMIFCSLCALMSVVLYFRVLRPRRGTMEWMGRVDRPKLRLFEAPKLCAADIAWGLLSMICAALLRFVYMFFWLRLHLRPNALSILMGAAEFIFIRMGLAAGLAIGIFLLLRCMFEKPLPAVCLASLAGLLVSDASDTLLLLTFSFLCLYLWMTTDDNKALLPGGFWLVGSGLFFAWSCLTCLQTTWLLPLYLAAYVGKQVIRFYRGDPAHRNRKLIISMVLFVLCLMCGAVVIGVFYLLLSGRFYGDLMTNLRTLSFYKSLLPVFREKLMELTAPVMGFRQSVLVKDFLLFVFGCFSAIPVCHGLFCKKDMRCLWLLILAAVFALPWLICGIYFVNLPMLLLMSYSWSTYCDRERGWLTLVFSLLLSGSYLVFLI